MSRMWGHTMAKGDMTVAANWQENNALLNSERGLTADQDYRRFGGRDYRRSSGSYPANIYSLDGCPPEPDLCFVPIEDRGNLPGLEIGRASCRERVCQYVSISVVDVSFIKKNMASC